VTHKINWDGPPRKEFEPVIRNEIDGLLENGLACASDLFFHSIWLDDDDPDGPTIFVYGKLNDDAYYVEYVPTN
jgi:hypothetical protein